MAEALSQNQIDELLNRMRSGEVTQTEDTNQNKVKKYNFSTPKKFTKDQLKSLNNLYENYARILAAYFTSIMRNVCEVNITQIEEQKYYEFNNALPDNTLIGMIAFKPDGNQYDESTIMMQMPTSFGYLLIDRLMGGFGPVYAPERDYTEIELSLLQLVMQNITKYMQEAWSNFFKLKTSLRSMETNGRLLQAYSQQDIVVIITLELKDETYSGLINICMPAENLEAIISNFSLKYAHSVKQQDPEKEQNRRNSIFGYLKESDLEIEAVLDCCQMNLSEIAMLQQGDVIALNKKIDHNIDVTVEGIPWCTARLGEVNKKKALKLVEIFGK